MSRAFISLKTKLASALLQLRYASGEAFIPYEDAKQMSADQIISLFQWDHNILHSTDPIDEPWNLTPMFITAHREKSKQDTAKAAKIKRLRGETCNGPRKAIPQRVNPWPLKGTRKLPSRPFPSKEERT